ncbi:MAG: T9SS type A sorting domain-containing protein [Flavobacteriales bacterium]|nr:T9SS type A sorting domain-containing protein [Flavobacteriales bacterium]
MRASEHRPDLAAEVLDASGRVVKQTVPVVVARSSTIRMDLSDLASGRYQVRLTGAQGTTSLPFVKI